MGLETFQDWRLVVGGHLSPTAFTLLVLGAVLATVLSALSLRGPARAGRRWPLFVLRVLAIAGCLVVALEPSLELRQVTRIPNHIAILVDGSRSMTVTPPSGEESRQARAADIIADSSALIGKWQQDGHRVDIYRFGSSLTPATREGLSQPARDEATRIGESLTELKSRYAGRDLGAIIVVSDGIDTGRIGAGPVDGDTRAAIKALDAPVHTVWMGESSLKDLSIATVLADDFAFVRTPIKLEAVVRHAGLGGRSVEVTLHRDGRLIDSRTVALTGDASEAVVSFPFTPQQPGNSVFEIATPVLTGEALSSNNKQVFTLKIIRDRVRVLHVAGRPSWDQRFVRSLLRLDPNVDLVSFFILRTEGDDPPWGDQRTELSLIPFPFQEIFDEQLRSFDLIILQNFNYIPYQVAPYLAGVRDYVLSGGALAMIGGDLSFASGAYGPSALHDVLPVELDGIPTTGDGAFYRERFKPRLTDEGKTHPITSLSLDTRVNEKRWDALPALEGLNRVSRVRPGASVLLEHGKVKTTAGEPAPVVAVADMGKGRSMAVLTDSAWHWGFLAAGEGDDGRAFQRFWESAIRWLVRDPALTLLRLELERMEYHEGQAVNLRLRTLHADYTAAPETKVDVAVYAAGRTDDSEPLQRLETTTGGEGEAHLEVGDLPQGAFRVRARATIDGRELTEEKNLVVRPEGRELDDVVARKEVLRELAEAGGGQFLEESLSSLPVKPLREERLGRRKAFELGSHPGLLLLSLALLCSEWALRRRRGFR